MRNLILAAALIAGTPAAVDVPPDARATQGRRADTPAVKVVPTQVDGLVVVEAVVNGRPDDLVQTTFRWVVEENGAARHDGVVYFPGNSKFVVAAGPKGNKFAFTLDTNFLFGVRRQATVDGRLQDVYTRVEVESPDPVSVDFTVGVGPTPPAPQPTPMPDPDPTFPVGRFGLASWAYGVVKADDALGETGRYAFASAIGSNYKAAADSSESDTAALLKMLATANRASLAALDLGDRVTAVKGMLGGKVYDMTYGNEGGIKTAGDLKDAFREIATGLLGVKK